VEPRQAPLASATAPNVVRLNASRREMGLVMLNGRTTI
jgi:hypothetical protein